MANVQFLRGAHVNLPTGENIKDGAFYLTSDSNRLYVGKGTGKSAELVELNKSVTIVDYVSTASPGYDKDLNENKTTLPASTSGVQNGQFYLAIKDNVLCVYDNGWKQINKNTDTTNKSLATAASATGSVTLTLTDSENKTVEDTFAIAAGDNITVSGAEKTVTVTGAKYSLDIENASTQDEDIVNVNLKNDHSSNTNNIDDIIKFKAGNDIKLKAADDAITIEANTVEKGTLSLNKDGTISLQLQNQDNQNIFGTALTTNAITYKIGDTAYVPGDGLPVYTKTEIDNKLNGLNGMTYKGTVGVSTVAGVTATVSTLPTENVKSGDTYLAIANISSVNAKKGDLIIATGTEVNGVIPPTTEGEDGTPIPTTLAWTVVPAGDDDELDTHYAFVVDSVNNKIQLKGSDNLVTGTYTTTAGDQIVVSSKSADNDKSMTTTIAHGTITRNDSTADSVTDATSVTFIEGVSANNGHVTGTTSKTVNLRTYTVANETTVSNTNDAATITTKLQTGENQVLKSLTQKVSSSTLKIEAGDDNKGDASHIDINLVWGSFNPV